MVPALAVSLLLAAAPPAEVERRISVRTVVAGANAIVAGYALPAVALALTVDGSRFAPLSLVPLFGPLVSVAANSSPGDTTALWLLAAASAWTQLVGLGVMIYGFVGTPVEDAVTVRASVGPGTVGLTLTTP